MIDKKRIRGLSELLLRARIGYRTGYYVAYAVGLVRWRRKQG